MPADRFSPEPRTLHCTDKKALLILGVIGALNSLRTSSASRFMARPQRFAS
jgi:hypothetical protein